MKTVLIFLIMLNLSPLIFAENPQEYNNTGISHMNAGDYKRAIEYFEKAYNLAKGNDIIRRNLSYAYTGLSYQYAKENNWRESVNFGEKAYNLDNSNAALIKNLAVFYNNYGFERIKERYFDDAYLNLNRSLNYNSNNWNAYVGLGQIMYEQGKIDETITYWKKAVSINPNIPDIENRLKALEKESKIGEKFKHKEYAHFEVKYEGYARQDLAMKVLRILENAYDKLGYDFHHYPPEKTIVIIYTEGQFKEVTGRPDWLPAEAESGSIIRVTANDIEKSEDRLKNVLYHEYTHVLLYRKIGINIPRWLNEGLAQYKEPSTGDKLSKEELILLMKALKNKHLLYISDLDNAFFNSGNRETTGLAYIEAKLLIHYLVDRYNFYRIMLILDKLKDGKDINTVLKDVLYMDTVKFEQRWLEWVKDKYIE